MEGLVCGGLGPGVWTGAGVGVRFVASIGSAYFWGEVRLSSRSKQLIRKRSGETG